MYELRENYIVVGKNPVHWEKGKEKKSKWYFTSFEWTKFWIQEYVVVTQVTSKAFSLVATFCFKTAAFPNPWNSHGLQSYWLAVLRAVALLHQDSARVEKVAQMDINWIISILHVFSIPCNGWSKHFVSAPETKLSIYYHYCYYCCCYTY